MGNGKSGYVPESYVEKVVGKKKVKKKQTSVYPLAPQEVAQARRVPGLSSKQMKVRYTITMKKQMIHHGILLLDGNQKLRKQDHQRRRKRKKLGQKSWMIQVEIIITIMKIQVN